MKIASVMTSVSRKNGGLFDSVRLHSRALAQYPGTDVSVWGIQDEATREDAAAWAPVPVHTFPIIGPRKFAYSLQMRKALFAADLDLLHTQGLWEYPSMLVAAWHRKFRRPYLISPHGMLDPWALGNAAWKKRIAGILYEKEHLKNARAIRALAEAEAVAIRKCGLKNPICILPNGISIPAHPAGGSSSKSVLAARAEGRNVLLYLGRIHPKKGLANLIRAWKAAAHQPRLQKSWVLAIAGWDQDGHEAELRALCLELGLDHSVHFIGPQFNEDKAACYRDCHAFILPSLSEGLPMVVLEAWSYAKPVLMTPECNLPQGFAAQAAVRIDAEPQRMAAGLLQLVEMSDADRTAMGERGLNLARTEFSWSKIAADSVEVFRWMLGDGPMPGCILPGK